MFDLRLPVLAASSKIDKKSLPPVDYQRDVVEADALPQTETEQKLAAIWAEILQVRKLHENLPNLIFRSHFLIIPFLALHFGHSGIFLRSWRVHLDAFKRNKILI
jgi:hypothetical protein